MTDKEFSLKLAEVKDGYKLWEDIVERHSLSINDYVIAFPHDRNPVNECGIAHLKQFIEYTRAEKIVILCVGHSVAEKICSAIDIVQIVVETLKDKEMESIITCYSLVRLSPHFIMMSLTKPYGRYGDKVLVRNGITLDEIVALGIYGMTEKEVFDNHKCMQRKGNINGD